MTCIHGEERTDAVHVHGEFGHVVLLHVGHLLHIHKANLKGRCQKISDLHKSVPLNPRLSHFHHFVFSRTWHNDHQNQLVNEPSQMKTNEYEKHPDLNEKCRTKSKRRHSIP